MNMWNNTTARNRSLHKHIQLLISPNRQLQVPGSDPPDLEVLGGVAGQFEHFGSQVLQDRSRVHCSSGTHALFGTDTGFQETVDTTHWELEACSVGTGLGGFFGFPGTHFATFTAFSAFSNCHFFSFYYLNFCSIIYLIQFNSEF